MSYPHIPESDEKYPDDVETVEEPLERPDEEDFDPQAVDSYVERMQLEAPEIWQPCAERIMDAVIGSKLST